jgi:hypothetical protein
MLVETTNHEEKCSINVSNLIFCFHFVLSDGEDL